MKQSEIKTLQDLMEWSVEFFGAKTFMREKKGKEIKDISFEQLRSNCQKLGRFLNEKSGGGKLHAAVIGPTSSAYLTAYFAAANNGHIIIPLDAQMSEEDLCDHLRRSEAQVLFFDKRYLSWIESIQKNCPLVSTCISLQEVSNQLSLPQIVESYEAEQWRKVEPQNCAAILYTSGTTGKSKGVMLSHSNFIDNAMCQENESSPEDSLLTVLPIHHVYCFTCDILLALRYGATVCVNDSMMHIAQNLKEFQPTIMLIVPMIAETIYKKIKAASDSMPNVPIQAIAKSVFGGRLRGIYSGGAYLNPDLITAYQELGIPIAQGYGMTECSPRISTATLEDKNDGSVGTIVNGCEVKIVDGEIWVKSDSVMMGYYKDEISTAETLTDDGWLKTGDLGYVGENNRLHITGRKKNLIILSNGENVSPEELENKFAGLDWLSEVLVYAENGIITAEIFPNKEFCTQNNANVKELIQEQIQKINKSVSTAKAIRCIRIREIEFDKTTSKKIKRTQSVKGDVLA